MKFGTALFVACVLAAPAKASIIHLSPAFASGTMNVSADTYILDKYTHEIIREDISSGSGHLDSYTSSTAAFTRSNLNSAVMSGGYYNSSGSPLLWMNSTQTVYYNPVGGYADIDASISLTYYAYLSGPTTNSSVPVYVHEKGSMTRFSSGAGYNYGYGYGSIDIEPETYPSSYNRAYVNAGYAENPKYSDEFDKTSLVEWLPNVLYKITMKEVMYDTLYAHDIDQLPTGYAEINMRARLDPTFLIDPTFAGASDYSFVVSPGIDNGTVSGVPLPASAPMFGTALVGLAGLGYAVKRKAKAA